MVLGCELDVSQLLFTFSSILYFRPFLHLNTKHLDLKRCFKIIFVDLVEDVFEMPFVGLFEYVV